MKALLINPPTGLFVREDRCQSAVGEFAVSFLRPPHDLMLMASAIKDVGVESTIRDYPVEKKSWDDFERDFNNFYPDALIVSATTPSIKEDLKACDIARKISGEKVITIAKGAHFIIDDISIFKEFEGLDIVIRQEPHRALKDILLNKDLKDVPGITFRLNGKIIRNPDRELLDDLDTLPIPARELIDNNLYVRPDTNEPMALIETSRGCPYECIFCLTSSVSGRKLKKRTPKLIVDEAVDCMERFKICNFHFKSDTFTCDKDWVRSLCNEIINRRLNINWICNSRVDTIDKDLICLMKKAGCFAVGFGIESANQTILDKIKKKTTVQQAKDAINLCKKAQVMCYAYFMIGFPWDTMETISDSIKFAMDADPDFVDFFIAYPFPGTRLWEILKEYNLLEESHFGVKAYARSAFKTFKLNEDELHRIRKQALRRFYLRPGYIVKMLLKAGSFKVAANYIKQGGRVFLNVIFK